MTTQATSNDQLLPTIDVAELSANLARLTGEQHQQLAAKMPANKMDLFNAYMYIESFQRNPETANTFCIPAMLVAAIAGRGYQDKAVQWKFVQNILRQNGTEGIDWTFLTRKNIFSTLNSPATLEFHLTCMKDGPLIFRRNCGNAAKFPYVTPMFAMKLLMMMQSPRRDDFVSLGMAALSAVGSMLRGETVEVLDGAGNVVHSLGDSLAKGGRGRKRKTISDTEAWHAMRRFESIGSCKTLMDKLKSKFGMNPGRYAEIHGLINKYSTTRSKKEWNTFYFGDTSTPRIKNVRDHATPKGCASVNFMQNIAEDLVDHHDCYYSYIQALTKNGEGIMRIVESTMKSPYVEPESQMTTSKTKRIRTTLALTN